METLVKKVENEIYHQLAAKAKPTFEEIWGRIREHSGETFKQIRGGKFTYEFRGRYIVLSRTNHNISQSDFKEAYNLVPLMNTVPVQHLRGPSHLYVILMDKRIRNDDW